MNKESKNPEKQYFGLLGLDRLPIVVKIINVGIAVIVGTSLAFTSWYYHFYRGMPSYISPPFLPLIFAWPLCGIVIWLRLTGTRWIWCLIACGLILAGYYILQTISLAVGQFIS